MSQISRFLRKIEGGYGHWCPGCNEMHFIAVDKPLSNGARWTFDGNLDAPTFSPSIKVSIPGANKTNVAVECCHYFIKSGNIEFCRDSTHNLAGKTVPLPSWPKQE